MSNKTEIMANKEVYKLNIVRNTSTFRSILIIWLAFWTFVDAGYIYYYTITNNDYTRAMAPYDLTGVIISVSLGFVIIYLLSNFFYLIRRAKRLPVELFAAAGFMYFFLRNILTTLGRALNHDVAGFETRAANFSFTFMWMIPTIVMVLFFLNFLRDLREYNEDLEA